MGKIIKTGTNMFFPYFDENPKQRVPYLTYIFIAINIVVFFLLNFRPDFEEIVSRFGFIPAQLSPVALITSMFLHVNFIHLLGNMWFLWLFGDNIEDKFGSIYFIFFYLSGGIFANLAHILFSSGAMRTIPCIGASGSISAIMGAYFLLFPRAKISNIFFIYCRPIKIKINAYVFLGVWALFQLLYAAFSSGDLQVTSVAYGAHIGGFLFGILAGLIIRGTLLKSDTLLMSQELEEEEEQKEFDEIIHKAVEIKKEKAKGLREFEEEIGRFLDEGDNERAIEAYTLFESQSIPGALKPVYQQKIADLLNAGGKDLLALQAYLRLIAQYSDHQFSAAALCRVGLLYSRKFKDAVEGFSYLLKGIERAEEISDKNLIEETQKEMARLSQALHAVILESAQQEGQFCVVAQLFDETLWNSDRIMKVLRSAGMKDGKNIGMKLAYNAERNLRKKDGIILQKITKEEALESVRLIQSIGIPAIAVSQKDMPAYPFIRGIRKVSLREDGMSFVGEDGKTYDLAVNDIVYICLAQLPYFIYGRTKEASPQDVFSKLSDIFAAKQTAGTWTLVAQSKKKGEIKDLKFNRVLDIFTSSGLRLRLSNLSCTYEGKDSSRANSNDTFAFMVEDIAALAGGEKIDENVELFISTSTWLNTYYRNVQELNNKGLWKMRLHLIYDKLL
ncbi:MAG: rhomboid family intramembrane serine protease [Candidatus Omnitrophica bacterium]|nr:rhomboid family intramembrane serine protease [Candidatus Omnitrophota bacterium]MBD3269741.1 rhomboid family intramembrane serine protease [Candidatus Omnitrophota bacterium]